MNFPLIILGAGGHAKVLIDTLKLQNKTIRGLTDPDQELKEVRGLKVLGSDEIILSFSPNEVSLVNGLGSTKTTENRRLLYKTFKDKNYSFPSIIHPSAIIAPDVEIAEGVQIMAGAVIQTGSTIGENSIVNTRASIDHDCRIGAHVHVAPGVTLSGGVNVADGVHIGAGATVVQGINIGKNSVIGAGAVVIKDVPEGKTVIGVPAREV